LTSGDDDPLSSTSSRKIALEVSNTNDGFEKEPLRRFRRRVLLTRDEAQLIAAIFAKLPELLGKPET
jgi:hypothetical protein